MSDRLTVKRDGKPIYDIVIEHSFSNIVPELKKLGVEKKKICIVTDTVIGSLYEKELKALLEQEAKIVITFTFPAGESYKTLDTVKALYKVLIEAKFDRSDMLVALGGGVIGDLTGFAAATYLRGIQFIQVPTTLLAQVDSSVGGKTGVDFDGYKNMVGAFCMPSLVYMNMSTLNTLDRRIYLSGMGEVIKYGLIRRPDFYEWLLLHAEEIKDRKPEAIEYMVSVSCDTKRAIVEEDPLEHGVRALLNLGHTLGHAIEKKKDFSMYHGECVAAGTVTAAYISYIRGMITEKELDALRQMFKTFELPVTVDELTSDEVIETSKSDKKMDQGVIKFILLKSVGEAYIDRTVTKEEMKEALQSIGCR